MKNLRIFLPIVNGSEFEINFANGRELINELISDDFAAPPNALCIEVISQEGKTITITIPYDDRDEAFVRIEDIPS